jgi:VIT1/CCC1 family predicted Fe2+/Mn2+ transporter
MATTTHGDASGRDAVPAHAQRTALLREAVFGINDGLVATVGLVSGEALSHQPHGAILVAALSATGAATVSMAIGSYLASRSERDMQHKLIRDQAASIRRSPSGQEALVRRLLTDLGVGRETVAAVAREITGDRRRWLRFLVRERLGLHEGRRENPIHNAAIMAVAVVLGSLAPILPFLLPLGITAARNLAWGLSLAAAFGLGLGKAAVTDSPRWGTGLQFMLLVSASAAVGAGIGLALGAAGA